MLFSQDTDPVHQRSDLVGAVHIHPGPDVALNRVKHNQPCMGLHNGLLQPVILQCQRSVAVIDHQHLVTGGTGGDETRLNSIRQTVLRRLVDHIAGCHGRHPVPCGSAGGQARNQLQNKGGFSFTGIALNDGDLSAGNEWIYQPLHFLYGNCIQGNQFYSTLIFHKASHFFFKNGGCCGKISVVPDSYTQQPLLVLSFIGAFTPARVSALFCYPT